MDLSLLPAPASEYNEQRTGTNFTVRSANSPSYSLTRRPGVRKPRVVLEEKSEGAEELGKRERYGTEIGPNGPNSEEDDKIIGHQNDTAEKTITDFGTDRSGNPASEILSRSELRERLIASRSKSLDWRTGERNPDRGTRADMFTQSTKIISDIIEQAGGLDERRTGVEDVRDRVMSSMKVYRSPVSPTSETLNKVSRGHSLPSKLRSESGQGSGARGTATSLGSKGGQSILERIEKLYGSNCKEPTTGGTFPRRSSSEEGSPFSPVQSMKSLNWTKKDALSSESTLSPGTSRTRERISGGHWQGQIPVRNPEDGGLSSGSGLEDVCTMSLDRARSRCTPAAQIRSARDAEGITETAQINDFSEEEERSGSLRDLSESSEMRGSGSKYQGRLDHGEERGYMNGTFRDRTGWLEEQEIEADDGANKKNLMKGSTSDEDVFMSNPQKSTLEATEKKKGLPSAASVRKKISQFEALSQRTQGLATGQILMPRRALSVPTQLSRVRDGGKISGSTKVLREKEEGEACDQTEEKVKEAGKKLGSERSLSVDEVGLRLGRKEREANDLVKNERKESGDNCAEDFDKYSRLKSTLEIPPHGGAQRQHRNYNIDETDFYKVSSPNEASERPPFSPASNSSDTPAGVEKKTSSWVTSPDEDMTPINTPNHSPFLSPTPRPENTATFADGENDMDSVFIQAAETPERDSSPLPSPFATSSHGNFPDLLSPDINTAHAKEKLFDMDAWVAGLKPKMKAWNNDAYDYYDDDDDDDASTQRDEDSNYDSDSGESSVTITSNMSQSDRKSFCVSLSDLCNFAGVDYESENDSDEWQSSGRRTASLSSDMSALSYVSVLPSEELDRLLEDVRSLGDNTLQDYNDVQVVVLHKEVAVGLGFSLAGGVDQNKPITVHKVFPLGVAAREGSIQEGDQVLSINGTALCGYAHWEALRILRRAKTRDMGVVVVKRGGSSIVCKGGAQTSNQGPTHIQSTETGQRVCVRLEKNSRDLGFSLEGGVGSSLENKPLTVQKIFLGGPADKVFPGDEVVEIEGVSMVGMRRLEAWTLIRRLPSGPVDVVLRRLPSNLEK